MLKNHFRYMTSDFLCMPAGRGGQSALRFARLRMEKRHNYVRKVSACSASYPHSICVYVCGWVGWCVCAFV